MAVSEVAGWQEPRILVVPDGDEHPRWPEVLELVDALGYDLDPWQQEALRVSLLRRGDVWAAFTVAVCCPRQNGKNSLLEVVEVVKSWLLGERLLIHTAHLADTSKEAFHRLDDLIDGNDQLRNDLKHVWRANGMETIEFNGNRRIRFRTRTRGGGRGYAGCTTAVFDEAMFIPEVSLGSVLPVISATPDPQVIYTGSAVDQETMADGVVFARVRERALQGDTERLAYFEWSLDAETPEDVTDELAGDPDNWARTNPALGIRITPEYLKVERSELHPRTFAVERLGVGDWPDTDGSDHGIIPQETWNSLLDADGRIAGAVCFAFDVSPDRTCSIAVCGKNPDGVRQVEIVDSRQGTGWAVDRLLELDEAHTPALIVCDEYGPAASLLPALKDAGVKVRGLNSTEHAQACGMFLDAAQQENLRHLGSLELRDAVRGAVARPLGDSWAFSRKNSHVDISPLVAATFAHWAAATTDADNDWTFH